jgi:hypothetical protein
MASITRKEFLRIAAVGLGALAGGRFLSACGESQTKPTVATPKTGKADQSPTKAVPSKAIPPVATETVVASTPTAQVPSRAELIKFHPAAPSRVVHTHHGGVWEGDQLNPEALKQMLDVSITRLTGVNDAHAAWKILFDPGERIAIKVNTLPYGSFWTHLPLVMAVAEKLQQAGIPAEQIIIYDRASSDLKGGGFAINKDGPGVRCYGTDGKYQNGWTMGGRNVGLSEILLGCDALINMPILKTHSMDGAGMSFAMKNHYGTFDQPQNFHYEKMLQGLPELNALAPIQERTRLIVGDALKIVQDNWYEAFDSDFICMSFDPVAHDTLGLKALNEIQAANGIQTEPTRQRAVQWLKNAADLGIGTDQMDNIEFLEERIG